MAPHATFVGGTFERMKAKQTKLFKERKQSETQCTSLINIRDNFLNFFNGNLLDYVIFFACPFKTDTNCSQQSAPSSNF